MTTEANPLPVADRQEAAAGPSWGALAVVLVGTFITVLDYFIVNVAIPAIQSDLHASSAQSQGVIIGYGLAFTGGMITGGRLGDLYGRRRMYELGIAVFTVASAACGFAPSAGFLIGARIVQGLAAALLVPQVLGILTSTYTGERRGRAFNVYGLTIGFASVFGQLIGGVLITVDIAGLGWRSIFLINIVVGAVAVVLTRRLVPESRGEGEARLDVPGAILVTAGLLAVTLPLIVGHEHNWPWWGWVSMAASVPLLGGFVAQQRRLGNAGRAPLIHLGLFRERVFSVGLFAVLLYFMAMGSFFLVLALYLQQGRGYSALESGLIFSALSVGYFLSSLRSGRLAQRLGRQLVALGGIAVAVGYTLAGLTVSHIGISGGIGWLIPSLLVAGVGMGMVTGPLTNAVLTGVVPDHAAAASGALSTMQEGGAALGVAVVGTVFYPALTEGRLESYAHAFSLGVIPLVCFSVVVAVAVQFFPRPAKQ
ncbi:EmrB/QacA subfamily drug resistance transporter [Streptomyces olivoverticillatus]|uniref:EmrB/QacA subfamily drug resistance transporter n=1 Tax=Streptomyces olivoverticillatus TaxID=66427 RepID=A0A7W7LNU0_9ACTN|nr:MFS transporter [Streptomyces olivoverticillatus]MBB4893664.1 EmrB/QacA subfamily drug resistance transporter [Streptomyces olivoverticillatus]